MLEYFTYKKVKKHQAEKKGREALAQVKTPPPLLDEEDERFLERIVSAEGTPPPLPSRPTSTLGAEAGDSTGNNAQLVVKEDKDGKGKARKSVDKGKARENEKPATGTQEAKKANRLSFLARTFSKKEKPALKPNNNVPATEAASEEDDITKILDDLNLSAQNNRAFSLSSESQKLVQDFTVILKDLINGVPTAYDDLTHLLDNSSGTLSSQYEKLPSFLKKLITQLPEKLQKNLGPELLAVAAEAQALNTGGKSSGGGIAGAAKSFLTPTSLKNLVTKPGAVVSMLKAIMNALKLRWPAFMGTNVLLSLGLFVLLFVFWYCHKRGREVRLERERNERGEPIDSEGRVIELEDDPMLAAPGPSTSHSRTPSRESRRSETVREARRSETVREKGKEKEREKEKVADKKAKK